ncbi:MAG: biotin/lipoate A/B protein ligase family protein [Acidimicrobiales bacterium]
MSVGGLHTPAGVAGAPAGAGGVGDAGRWQVRRLAGPAGTLHHRPWPRPVVCSVSFLTADRPALVLGSTQPETVADPDRLATAGVELVRRRSGGGAVLLHPGSVVWADVMVPAGDGLWCTDVGRAFLWLGRVWAEALAAVGVDGAAVHTGPLVRSEWSDLVCFAGLGPGEITLDGRKVVGMSQRRTREGALFQCAALLRWDVDRLAGLLGLDASAAAELAGVATGLDVAAPVLEQALVDALAAS